MNFLYSIGTTCNFHCPFCRITVADRTKKHSRIDFGKLEDFLKRIDDPHIWISGGEPSIFPQVDELMTIFENSNCDIKGNTNFTGKYVPRIFESPSVKSHSVSFHPTELERLNLMDTFCKNVEKYKSKISQIVIVDYPPGEIDNYLKKYSWIRDYGIKVYTFGYTGMYKGKYYNPTLKRFGKDKKCSAGYNSFLIQVDGTICRCLMKTNKISGNAFKNIGLENIDTKRKGACHITCECHFDSFLGF